MASPQRTAERSTQGCVARGRRGIQAAYPGPSYSRICSAPMPRPGMKGSGQAEEREVPEVPGKPLPLAFEPRPAEMSQQNKANSIGPGQTCVAGKKGSFASPWEGLAPIQDCLMPVAASTTSEKGACCAGDSSKWAERSCLGVGIAGPELIDQATWERRAGRTGRAQVSSGGD